MNYSDKTLEEKKRSISLSDQWILVFLTVRIRQIHPTIELETITKPREYKKQKKKPKLNFLNSGLSVWIVVLHFCRNWQMH